MVHGREKVYVALLVTHPVMVVVTYCCYTGYGEYDAWPRLYYPVNEVGYHLVLVLFYEHNALRGC